ncbi:MAG: LysR substrate-binding domain-containing protein [Bauldia sp.]
MRNVTLKQLRSVAAILKSGRIVSAAKELNLTTPAITSQLKLLESALGVTLFDRTQTGMRPTAAGWEVFRTASRIADLLRECEERIDDLKGLRSGAITVGVVSTGKYFAPRLIAAFMKSHPHVEIRMNVGNRDAVVDALSQYSVDLAIMGRPPRDFEVEAVQFGPHPLVVIAPPDHPLVKKPRVPKRALVGELFLIREEGSGTRSAFDTFFSGMAVEGFRTGMEMGSNETIKQAVMAGLGIALISGHAIAAEIADGRLATIDVPGLPIMRQWYVVRRTDRTMSTAATAFYAFLRERGEEFLPSAVLFGGLGPTEPLAAS